MKRPLTIFAKSGVLNTPLRDTTPMTNCLSVFDHIVGLAPNGLKTAYYATFALFGKGLRAQQTITVASNEVTESTLFTKQKHVQSH